MSQLNLGILAHVDAGKTTLTERLLYTTGVIRTLGSVDQGTTQTDTLALERARGITIQAAVASFALGDCTVNLIDTPGHSDFIAEVDRSLRVLDGVILVVSAVEGVQPQTRRLARAIRGAGLPLLIFINKIDRAGARDATVLGDISQKLGLRLLPLSMPTDLGERNAASTPIDRDAAAWLEATTDLLAEESERVIAEYERTDGRVSRAFLEAEIATQVAAGCLTPVYFGSAIHGTGVEDLLAGVAEWLPPATGAADAPLSATVFKIRRQGSEKLVYCRIEQGMLRVRDTLLLRRRNRWDEIMTDEEKVTGIDRFDGSRPLAVAEAGPGAMVALHGLRAARIGDQICLDPELPLPERGEIFPLPALESTVQPQNPAQIAALRTALEQLAEQDPLISLRQRNEEGSISVRLFGEVQREVLADTLRADFGIAVWLGESRVICIERAVGVGEHLELIGEGENPYYGTVGFRIEGTEPGSGIHYERQLGSLPPSFYKAIEEVVFETLQQGLYGWEVADARVILTQVGYWSPVSTAGDFRNLVPIPLMNALDGAGTIVCEPFERITLEIPDDTFGAVCGLILAARGELLASEQVGNTYSVTCRVPLAELADIQRQLPGLTRGEGDWDSQHDGYEPVNGEPPTRSRIGADPRNRAQYLAEVAQGQQ